MAINKITTEDEYYDALERLQQLDDSEPGSDEEQEFLFLATIIEEYENLSYYP